MLETTETYDIFNNSGVKKILDRVADERTFWNKIISAIDEALFIVDSKKRIVYFNKKAQELTGFTEEEVIGEPCLKAVQCINCFNECALFNEGKIICRNLTFKKKSGNQIFVVKNARVFTDANGEVIGGIETFRDVTDEVNRSKKTSREKARFEKILNNIGDGVIALDRNSRIVFVNEEIVGLLGYSASQLLGSPLGLICDESILIKHEKPSSQGGLVETVRTIQNKTRAVIIKVIKLDHDDGEINTVLLIRQVTPVQRVRKQLAQHENYRGIVSRSSSMISIFNQVETISDSDATVMIEGESGTGKELLANAIHIASSRKDKPFKVVNCAVFNENLLESELFGHCKGAFTGAINDKIGFFEQAHLGTIFLDEIGELPPNLQVKILRFLQNREFERVGEIKTRKVDVRIIAATNKNLLNLIEQGLFRDDLYYRLNVIPIDLPPLRDREEDAALLADFFLQRICSEKKVAQKVISDEAMLMLKQHKWPGNVRELENAILHAFTCSTSQKIVIADFPKSIISGRGGKNGKKAEVSQTVEQLEKENILTALRKSSFNRSKAADRLNITRTTLWRKMKKYNLQK